MKRPKISIFYTSIDEDVILSYCLYIVFVSKKYKNLDKFFKKDIY